MQYGISITHRSHGSPEASVAKRKYEEMLVFYKILVIPKEERLRDLLQRSESVTDSHIRLRGFGMTTLGIL